MIRWDHLEDDCAAVLTAWIQTYRLPGTVLERLDVTDSHPGLPRERTPEHPVLWLQPLCGTEESGRSAAAILDVVQVEGTWYKEVGCRRRLKGTLGLRFDLSRHGDGRVLRAYSSAIRALFERPDRVPLDDRITVTLGSGGAEEVTHTNETLARLGIRGLALGPVALTEAAPDAAHGKTEITLTWPLTVDVLWAARVLA